MSAPFRLCYVSGWLVEPNIVGGASQYEGQASIYGLHGEPWREVVLRDPRGVGSDQGRHEAGPCPIEPSVLQHDDIGDRRRLAAWIGEDVELGHGSEGREFVAKQAMLPVERAELVHDAVEGPILVAAPGALTFDEVIQEVLEGAAEIARVLPGLSHQVVVQADVDGSLGCETIVAHRTLHVHAMHISLHVVPRSSILRPTGDSPGDANGVLASHRRVCFRGSKDRRIAQGSEQPA